MPEIPYARKTVAAGALTGPGLARDPWTRYQSERASAANADPSRIFSGRTAQPTLPDLTRHLCGRLESVAQFYPK